MTHLDLEHDSPVPLYHQIAQAIRYRIATGALRPGTALPPLREAAHRWGANLHTVRRAYVELAREGLVVTQVPSGTVVLPGGDRLAGETSPALGRFVDGVIRDAKQGHGLSLDRLIEVLERRRISVQASSRSPTAFVVECSETQSADLAAQIMARWRVTAIPWPLGSPAPPGSGPIIATYFHYADIRSAWRARIGDVHFLGIRPDPQVGEKLARHARGGKRGAISVTFCEREESMLHNIAADLAQTLPPSRFRIVPRLVTRPSAWMTRYRGADPVLFSPRVWGDLPARLRSDPRALEARYVFETKDLEAIGRALNWRSP